MAVNLKVDLWFLSAALLVVAMLCLLAWAVGRSRPASRLKAAEQREQELRESEEGFRALVQNTADIITVLDADGAIRYGSPAVKRLLGYEVESLAGKNLAALVHPDDTDKLGRLLAEVLRSPGKIVMAKFRVQHELGHWLGLEALGENLQATPGVGGIMLTSRDISEDWLLEEQLARRAFEDALTGLPNKALLMDRLTHALTRAGRDADPRMVALLSLDLDNLQAINDSLGHTAGDRLISQVAERIKASVREADTVARTGGDEFAVVLEDVANMGEAVRMAERVTDRLQVPFDLDRRRVSMTASIGIALGSPGNAHAGELVNNADTAMYYAKSSKKVRYAVFESSMNSRAWRKLEMEAELRSAVERDEFVLYYQPVLELGTGKLTGVEALVRWQHPERGLIPPGEFIPLAEETGLVVPIGRWVLREACRQVGAWQAETADDPALVLSVNLSVRQFAHPELITDTYQALQESGLSARDLELDITEAIALDHSEATVTGLRGLKDLGVRLAIDDFGTGYSALNYLKRYPVDTLKIDRSFIRGLGTDPEDMAIVHAVIAFARILKLHVIAEGIETPEQLAQLRALGCERGQGYYFSRPLPADEFGARLRLRAGLRQESKSL
jgi:diguanylate cyclase (GGDEF)-like protein/PAS domain S-box-containing protein